jgi:isopentenyl-diphosphate Delta-isomerase
MSTGHTDEFVVLVDGGDRTTGAMEKLEAHRVGALHRAFSVFVVRDDGAILLQRRADGKYHSAGLWTNSCCGHPRMGEAVLDAGRRRLREEMGIDLPLREVGTFTYRAELPNGLVEHEIDHVLIGRGDDVVPAPAPAEVSEWRWMSRQAVGDELSADPSRFTAWFPPALTAFDAAMAAQRRTTPR